MVALDAVIPFAVVIVGCVWQLWGLRRDAARKAVVDRSAPHDPRVS